jgi:hypothetical protein
MASEEATHQDAGSPAPATNGRTWAYLGAALGVALSITANILHSYVPPARSPGWRPHPGAIVFAGLWPVILLVAIEILARVTWRPGKLYVALRFGGLIPLATVAALVSYRHLSGLMRFYGEDRLSAALGPLAIDGLMVMASAALIATAGVTTAPLSDPEPDPVPREEPERPKPRTKPTRPRPRKPGKVVKTDEELVPALRQLITEAGGVPGRRRIATALGVADRRVPELLAKVNGTPDGA